MFHGWDTRRLKFMVNKNFLARVASTALLSAVLIGCGGGGGDGSSPIVKPELLKLGMLTGRIDVNHNDCQNTTGDISKVKFSNLIRISTYQDEMYLVDTAENCVNENRWSYIKRIKNTTVSDAVYLNSPVSAIDSTLTTTVDLPSAFYRASSGEYYVLGYSAASSDLGFIVNENLVKKYDADGRWLDFSPGLFRFTNFLDEAESLMAADYKSFVAGSHRAPAILDGQGNNTQFYAPHSLEVDSTGLMYVIDKGTLRTIDKFNNIKTLDLAKLGVMGAVKEIDSDRTGKIHVLASTGGNNYIWHRLSDGSKVNFVVNSDETLVTEIKTIETFTVVGDQLLLAVRTIGSDISNVYRVSAQGKVSAVDNFEFPDNSTKVTIPRIQHLEYGVDNNLYIVLRQGVLVAKNFK